MAQISISDFLQLEEPVHEALDPISSWYTEHDCHSNPFASSSFIRSPIVLGNVVSPDCCDCDWFSETDSDSVREINCFVTNLFERRSSDQINDSYGRGTVSVSFINELGIGGFETGEDGGLIFGLDYDGHETGEFSGSQGVYSHSDGLRIVDLSSESDSDNGVGGVVEFDSRHPSQDLSSWVDHSNYNLRLGYEEDFDWEEVGGRENERENLSTVVEGEVEELSAASGFSTEEDVPLEEAFRNLDWEVLLAVNSLGRNAGIERFGDGDSYLVVQDDYAYAVDYDTLFGQLIESESASKGSPPAAQSIVENLPFVELTVEELKEDDVVCAVCKDRILLEEKVRRLPCWHHYHGDCIVPWLCIRNTCPVCRYELPTDDPDYERRKSQRIHLGLSGNSG